MKSWHTIVHILIIMHSPIVAMNQRTPSPSIPMINPFRKPLDWSLDQSKSPPPDPVVYQQSMHNSKQKEQRPDNKTMEMFYAMRKRFYRKGMQLPEDTFERITLQSQNNYTAYYEIRSMIPNNAKKCIHTIIIDNNLLNELKKNPDTLKYFYARTISEAIIHEENPEHTARKKEIDNLENRITRNEKICTSLNTTKGALKTLEVMYYANMQAKYNEIDSNCALSVSSDDEYAQFMKLSDLLDAFKKIKAISLKQKLNQNEEIHFTKCMNKYDLNHLLLLREEYQALQQFNDTFVPKTKSRNHQVSAPSLPKPAPRRPPRATSYMNIFDN